LSAVAANRLLHGTPLAPVELRSIRVCNAMVREALNSQQKFDVQPLSVTLTAWAELRGRSHSIPESWAAGMEK
jgi:hypothetical protein